MRVFLICMLAALLMAGFAAMAMPVDAQIGFPATLTPFPTFDLVYDSPAQATLARLNTDMIWWEGAPYVVASPRPGFVLYTIQWWQWIMDTTGGIIMYSLLLLVVIFIVLRFAARMRYFGNVNGSNVTVQVNQSNINSHNNP
jgi:hypothetical protein